MFSIPGSYSLKARGLSQSCDNQKLSLHMSKCFMLQFFGNDQMPLLFLHILDALAVVIEVANHANDTMKQGVSI